MFDEKTTEILKGKNDAALEKLVDGMRKRHEAARMKEAAQILDDDGKELLEYAYYLMKDDQVASLVAEGVGTVTYVKDVETGKKVSWKKVEKLLLEKGVAPTLIAEAKAEATGPSKIQDLQVRFSLPKD